ncbi:ankyrin repeat domain-containing protein [Rhabdochlamydiaceae symbiont of Dictyostelium giganteum]|uniref:ankyrin repeat domain-containing protein n=1 Tax=Rhabdochlamydiaceae symbiont of Dictyostelium giganteum TaxID=3342349 RepID=UPI00384CD810
MSAPLSNIQHQNNQPIAPIPSKPSNLVTSPYQGINSSQLDIKSIAISSIQKEQMLSFMKTCGFDDAWIQIVKEENLQSKQHLADDLFSHILHDMTPERWESLIYDYLLQLYDLQGMNLAFAAIREGKKEFFSYLINHISENDLIKLKGLEAREELRGKTLLHLVSIYGREDMLETLLHESSGIVNIKDKDALGFTALHLAIHEGHEKVIQKLLSYGMTGQELELEKHSISIIALAVASGYPNILELLLKHNQFKEISLLDVIPDVKTVLHLAIHLNQPKMLEYLLNHEHSSIQHLLEFKDASGRTPLQLAAFLGDLFAIRALVNKAVHIHKGEFEKCGTALHFAVKGKQPDAITLLLSLGADPHKTDEWGKAPLAYLHGEEAEHVIMKRCKNILENFIASKRLEKVKVVDFNERAPFNLILEGSYDQREGFAGIVKGLESKKILKDIRRFSGVGMGGIIATLLALGYTSSQIEDLSFDSLQDLFIIDPSLTSSQLGEVKSLNLLSFSEEKQLKFSLALCQIERLRSSLEEIINDKAEIENLTLKELTEKITRYPERYRHIHLSVYSLKTQKMIHFTSENAQHGDFLLSDVLTATLAFPGIFKPLILRRKNSDGGIYDDTTYGKMGAPSLEASLVDQFDGLMYQEDPYYQGKQTNYRTLTLKLDHQVDKNSQLIAKPSLLARLMHFHMDKPEKKISSEEISRGRIKILSFLEDEEDHITAAEKYIGLLFSSAKKTSIENSYPLVQPRSKGNLTPWKYDIFLKNNALSNESSLAKSPSCLNNIPPREIFFTGRVKELNDLKILFKDVSKVAIAGLGGMGKSTLSFKYASELVGYRFIHLIKATAPGAVRAGLIELAGLLNIKKEKPEDTLAELKVYLQQMILPGLIIIDGVDEESFFKELSDYIPHGKKCHILISTRIGDKAKVNGFKVILLAEFSEEEAIRYLTQIDQPVQEEQKAAEILAKAVGYHPLALSHIARYLEQEKISLCEYERRFKTRDPKLPGKDDIDLPTEEASIFITWQVSLDAIGEKEKGFLAIEMMRMIALLGEEDIPLDLLHTWAKLSYPHEDEVSISGAIKLLKGYSFFREIISEFDQKKYYQVHSLVQKVIALSLKEKKYLFFEKTCAIVNQTIKQLREPSYLKNNYFDQRLEVLYRAHLSHLHGMTNLFEALENHQKIQFLSHLGCAYSRYVSPLNIAHQYIDQGIDLLEKNNFELLKNKEIDLLNSQVLNSLGQEKALMMAELYQLKSRCIRYTESTEEAITLAEKALIIRKQILNHDDPYILESYDAVIWLLHDCKKFKKELPFVREALTIKIKNLGENHYETLKSRSRIVNILYDIAEDQDENKEALLHAKVILANREDRFNSKIDNDFDELFKSYDTVVEILMRLDKYQEALDFANIALKYKINFLGNNNNETLDVYERVIDILLRLENYQEAFFPAQQELKNRISFIKQPDDETESSYERFTDLLQYLILDKNMIFLLQELINQLGSSFGECHHMTLALYNKVIKLIFESKNEEIFLDFAKQRLDKQREQLGENHQETLNSYQKILKFLCDSQNEADVLSFAQMVVENQYTSLKKIDETRWKSYDIVIKVLNDLMFNQESTLTSSQEKLSIYEKTIKVLKNARHKDDVIFKFQRKLYAAQQILTKEKDIFKESYFDVSQNYETVLNLLKKIGQKTDIEITEQSILAQYMLEAGKAVLKEGNEVVHLFKELGQKEKALTLAQHLLEAREAVLENGSQWIFESYKIVIDLFKELGQKEKALPIAKKMLEASAKQLGEGNEWIFESYKIVIDLFKELGQKEEALTIVQNTLQTRINTLGIAQEKIFKSYEEVIVFLNTLRERDAALCIAQKMLEVKRELLGEGDDRTFVSYEIVIKLLKELG